LIIKNKKASPPEADAPLAQKQEMRKLDKTISFCYNILSLFFAILFRNQALNREGDPDERSVLENRRVALSRGLCVLHCGDCQSAQIAFRRARKTGSEEVHLADLGE
jgi:hypothetical protein